jgi:phospho-N-acetylmuramoyl-pentapeptide-transferase
MLFDWPGTTSPRAVLAASCSFLLALVWGPRLIRWLQAHYLEPVDHRSPEIGLLHEHKRRTPTMGGLFIVAGIVGGCIVFCDLSNHYIQVVLLVTIGLAAIGAVDDLSKLRGADKSKASSFTQNVRRGLSARGKLLAQSVVAGIAAAVLYAQQINQPGGLDVSLPGVGVWSPGLWFIPLAILVMVGTSNAVNLTDGLDGLAGGCLIFATAAIALMAYASGHAGWAEYLHLTKIAGAHELVIVAAAMIGGLLGFLWFNCHPAQVFMGDTGALPLGGLLGLMAVIVRQELLLIVIGGVFVAEAMSVILQVASFRWRGKRIFRCAPLHHHFELTGWPESKVVVRFWIASALCAIVGIASLKLNVASLHDERHSSGSIYVSSASLHVPPPTPR